MADETDDVWPARPSWGFAAFVVVLAVVSVLLVWAVNYWQAFGGRR